MDPSPCIVLCHAFLKLPTALPSIIKINYCETALIAIIIPGLQAPDIVICDLHPNYKVTADEFSLNERYTHMCM